MLELSYCPIPPPWDRREWCGVICHPFAKKMCSWGGGNHQISNSAVFTSFFWAMPKLRLKHWCHFQATIKLPILGVLKVTSWEYSHVVTTSDKKTDEKHKRIIKLQFQSNLNLQGMHYHLWISPEPHLSHLFGNGSDVKDAIFTVSRLCSEKWNLARVWERIQQSVCQINTE